MKINKIKLNHYKQSVIKVHMLLPFEEHLLHKLYVLTTMLNTCTNKYKTEKELSIECEKLYNLNISIAREFLGADCINNVLQVTFISPEYIENKNYLKDIIELIKEFLYNPLLNEENLYNAKKRVYRGIDMTKEYADNLLLDNAYKLVDAKAPYACSLYGTKEEIEAITLQDIKNTYDMLINKSFIEVNITGNTNLDIIKDYLKDIIKNNNIKSNYKFIINSKERDNLLTKEEQSHFYQTNMCYIFNVNDLTDNEKYIYLPLFHHILVGGGLSSKLYKDVREKHGYCYEISGMYNLKSSLYVIEVKLDYKNTLDTIKLIDKNIKDIQLGKFNEELDKSITMFKNGLKNKDQSVYYKLLDYETKHLYNGYNAKNRLDIINKVTKEDIVKVSKKLKPNLIYILKEANHE